MRQTNEPQSRKGQERRWCIPPAVLREPHEVLEGGLVLSELEDRNDLALALWMAVRDVTLWATTPPESRPGLFEPRSPSEIDDLVRRGLVPKEIRDPLLTLAAVAYAPESATEAAVTRACAHIGEWALRGGHFGTAVTYLQAGALASPEAPRPAYAVGHAARQWGRHRRAETWLRRAVGLARRTKEFDVYSAAILEIGLCREHLGDFGGARRILIAATRAGRRYGQRLVRGEALHGLLRVALATNDLTHARDYARRAFRAFGAGHSALQPLRIDYSRALIQIGEPGDAISVLDRAAENADSPEQRLVIHALAAHAAALVDNRTWYQESWESAWMIAMDFRVDDASRVEAILTLALAAAETSDSRRSGLLSRMAREMAAARPDLPARVAAALAVR